MSTLDARRGAGPVDLPDIFLPYQQELLTSVFTHSVTVAEKSRRTGYTWAVAAPAVLTAAATKSAGGMSAYYVGYNLEMAREFIDYCGMWAKNMQIAASEMSETFFTDPDHPEKEIKAFRVEFASGFEVVALPSMPRSLRGKQGLVIIDEAAFHDDLEGMLKAALALLMWGGRVVIISTHNGDINPFNALVQDIRAGKKPYHLLRCTFDDALAQGLYQRICLASGKEWSPEAEVAWRAEIIANYGDAADEELFVIPSEGGGAAIPRALIEKRMVLDGPVLRYSCNAAFVHLAGHIRTADTLAWCVEHLAPLLARLDPERAHVFGMDFARKGDLSDIVPLEIGKTLVRRAPFIVEMRNVPHDQQREILFYICDRLPRFRAGKIDAGGNGSYLGEVTMQRYGEGRIEPLQLSEPWYRENMPPLKAAFEDGTIELPRDAGVLDDLTLLRFVRGVIRVPLRTLDADGGQRHGDAAIALALAFAASRAEPEIYEYHSAGLAALKKPAMIMNADDWSDDAAHDPQAGFLGGLRGGVLPSGRGSAF